MGAQWLSGRVLDSSPRSSGFEPHQRHCVVAWARHIYPSLVLVQPRKTRRCLTERLLMGSKESNQTKIIWNHHECSVYHMTFWMWFYCLQSKKDGKDQEMIQPSPHLTQDTTWESNKNTINFNHQQEPRGQPFPSRWPQGSNKHTGHKKLKWSTKEVPPWNGQ